MISKYVIGILLVVTGLMGFYIKILTDVNNRLHENEGIYKTQIQELSEAIKSKDRDLDFCSQRTKQLKEESDRRAEAAKKAQSEAKKKSQENLRLADKILSLQRPKDVSPCINGNDIINNYIDARRERENITAP